MRGPAWSSAGRGSGVAEATPSIITVVNACFMSMLLRSPRNGPSLARPDQVAVGLVADEIEVERETSCEAVECRLRTMLLDPDLGQAAPADSSPAMIMSESAAMCLSSVRAADFRPQVS